jgi:uncharacterized surface protein with fasciclin (FAS1) repeats
MFGRTSLLRATALALPFSLAAAAAHAASIAETVQQHEELSTFAKAMAAAKFDQQLNGEGPYTVFAPTDQAFEQLPKGALDELLKQENQAQLTSLLEHHVVEGKAISAKDMLGQQSRIDAMSGEALTADGTSQMVLLVPTGLTIARMGDQMVIEREGVAISRRAIQVQDQVVRRASTGQGQTQGQGQMQGQEGQETAASTPTAQGSDMPMTEHQQQALQSHPAQEERQTAAQGAADMPASQHQQQVIQDQAGQGQGQPQGQQQTQGQGQTQAQEGQQAAASTPTAQGSDMPMTEHQQQALESHPAPEQRQTAAQGAADMPATEHQQQVIQDQAGQGQAQGQQQAQQQAPGQEGQTQAQEGQQAAASTPTAQGSDMPMSEHQQQALETHPAPEQRQTAAEGPADMPASPHQRQLLAEDELPGEQQQYHEDAAVQGEPDLLREASVVGADIQADNGVIHVIDAVLLPQDVVKMLEQAKQG